MNKTLLSCAIGVAIGAASFASHAAAVNPGDKLTIAQGVVNTYANTATGSWFCMSDSTMRCPSSKLTPISPAAGGAIVIGTTQAASGSHAGAINGSESPAFDIWNFFSNTGMDYTRVAPTGSTTAGINMSGWTVTWAGIPAINMGTQAWQPLNCSASFMNCTGYTFTNGIGRFQWDGIYGHSYLLQYAATVPAGDPSGFGGVPYYVNLSGVVQQAVAAVPVPAAVWLFGSGLLGLVGVARRKKKA